MEFWSFKDVISTPTEVKPESIIDFQNTIEDNEGLRPPQHFEQEQEEIQNPKLDFTEPYDAEKNAKSIVNLMTGIDSLLLNIAGQVKIRKNYGGRRGVERMAKSRKRQFNNQDLTAIDQKEIERFERYKADLNLLTKSVMPSKDEIDNLIQLAIPYCEETEFKLGAGSGFWIGYFGMTANRIIKIVNL
jgi:hypothetical protein